MLDLHRPVHELQMLVRELHRLVRKLRPPVLNLRRLVRKLQRLVHELQPHVLALQPLMHEPARPVLDPRWRVPDPVPRVLEPVGLVPDSLRLLHDLVRRMTDLVPRVLGLVRLVPDPLRRIPEPERLVLDLQSLPHAAEYAQGKVGAHYILRLELRSYTPSLSRTPEIDSDTFLSLSEIGESPEISIPGTKGLTRGWPGAQDAPLEYAHGFEPRSSLTTERDGGRRVQGRRHSEGVLASWVAVSLPPRGRQAGSGRRPGHAPALPSKPRAKKRPEVFDPELGLPFPQSRPHLEVPFRLFRNRFHSARPGRWTLEER